MWTFAPIELIVIAYFISTLVVQCVSLENEEKCEVQTTLDNNFLSPIDIFATNPDTDIACIKARFSLAFKLESIEKTKLDEDDEVDNSKKERVIVDANGSITDDKARGERTMYFRALVGYVPLEKLTYVEKTCPESIKPISSSKKDETTPSTNEKVHIATATTEVSDDSTIEASGTIAPADEDISVQNDKPIAPDDELEMIVKFECGKLAFKFRRDEYHSYLSSIVGVVQFDTKVSQFVYRKPILITSSSNYHFKFDEPIEIISEDSDGIWVLTANLYLTEIETFRNTKNRDFIKPADKDSKPYLEDPSPFNLAAAVEKLIDKQQN